MSAPPEFLTGSSFAAAPLPIAEPVQVPVPPLLSYDIAPAVVDQPTASVEVAAPPVKRGRGRPKKDPNAPPKPKAGDAAASTSGAPVDPNAPVKRGRGRPRKDPNAPVVPRVPKPPVDPNAPKRGRGRPKDSDEVKQAKADKKMRERAERKEAKKLEREERRANKPKRIRPPKLTADGQPRKRGRPPKPKTDPVTGALLAPLPALPVASTSNSIPVSASNVASTSAMPLSGTTIFVPDPVIHVPQTSYGLPQSLVMSQPPMQQQNIPIDPKLFDHQTPSRSIYPNDLLV